MAGANPRIIDQTPAAIHSFAQMALIIIGTGLMAAISMWFALTSGMKVGSWAAVPIAIFWGLLIINIDRYLTSNMKTTKSLYRLVIMVVPRLIMAVLIGVVISTPLVLKIFEKDIAAEVQQLNNKKSGTDQKSLELGTEQARLNKANERVAALQKTIAGADDLSVTDDPAVKKAQRQVSDLNAKVAAQQTVVDQATYLVECEAYNNSQARANLTKKNRSKCSPPGQTGKNPPYPQYVAESRKQSALLQRLLDQQSAANTTLRDAQDAASRVASAAQKTRIEQSKNELPSALEEQKAAQQSYDTQKSETSAKTQGADGLLSQLNALYALGRDDPILMWSHLAVGALFLMIEVLPVMVKLSQVLGEPSVYEEAEKNDRDTVVDRMHGDRRDHRLDLEASSQARRKTAQQRLEKEIDIEADMILREKKLALRANEHVATRMEDILEANLQRWGQRLTEQLQRETASSTTPSPATAPQPVAPPLSDDHGTKNAPDAHGADGQTAQPAGRARWRSGFGASALGD